MSPIAGDRRGRTFVDAGGERHGLFDLATLSDGACSTLRRALGCVRLGGECPWGSLRLVAGDPDGVSPRRAPAPVEV